MEYQWNEWLKTWRTIAKNSSKTEYTSITITVDDEVLELLRVSKFYNRYDGNKKYVETPIREFNNRTAFHSRATRDLGIVRVITSDNEPVYIIEPGAQVFDWMALTQGITVNRLEDIMRMGNLGRRVRRRDRVALKNSREQWEAMHKELSDDLHKVKTEKLELLKQLKETESERDNAMKERNRMQENLIEFNEEHPTVHSSSGTTASPLGTTKAQNSKLISNKALPGNFENGR